MGDAIPFLTWSEFVFTPGGAMFFFSPLANPKTFSPLEKAEKNFSVGWSKSSEFSGDRIFVSHL